jgi:hypothetical protein
MRSVGHYAVNDLGSCAGVNPWDYTTVEMLGKVIENPVRSRCLPWNCSVAKYQPAMTQLLPLFPLLPDGGGPLCRT